MEWQDADDAFELAMRSRANVSSDRGGANSSQHDRRDSEGRYGQQAAAPRMAAESLPQGWETALSRTTGQQYYVNQYTGETQYDIPTEPAKGGQQSSRPRDEDVSSRAKHITVRGPRDTGKDDWLKKGIPDANDPKSFLDFDAKACNLQSSRELFLQQMKGKPDKSKKKRSRSRKKKRKRSTSSSSSSSSSKRKKRKTKAPSATPTETPAAAENDEERINRIKKARELRRQGAANGGASKPVDGGSVIDD